MPHSELHKKKLKKNLAILAIIAGAVILFWGITIIKIQKAEAGEVVNCGAATSYDLETESNLDFCDIYTRQLQYREEAISLRNQITERSQNFAIPSMAARKNYEKELEALHNSITPDNIPSMSTH